MLKKPFFRYTGYDPLKDIEACAHSNIEKDKTEAPSVSARTRMPNIRGF